MVDVAQNATDTIETRRKAVLHVGALARALVTEDVYAPDWSRRREALLRDGVLAGSRVGK